MHYQLDHMMFVQHVFGYHAVEERGGLFSKTFGAFEAGIIVFDSTPASCVEAFAYAGSFLSLVKESSAPIALACHR